MGSHFTPKHSGFLAEILYLTPKYSSSGPRCQISPQTAAFLGRGATFHPKMIHFGAQSLHFTPKHSILRQRDCISPRNAPCLGPTHSISPTNTPLFWAEMLHFTPKRHLGIPTTALVPVCALQGTWRKPKPLYLAPKPVHDTIALMRRDGAASKGR